MNVLWRCRKCRARFEIPVEEFPITCCGIVYEYPDGVIKHGPGPIRRAANFAKAVTGHVLTGRETVDDATRQWRLEQCLACEQYYDSQKETCTHPQCGCGIKKQRGVIDKLSWASQRCPIGRWQYEPITVRNLIYHVCPLASNDLWRHNVRQLLGRIDVFNGRRIVAINVGDGMESPAEVHRAFEGEDYEFFYHENNPQLREVATFRPLLERIANVNRDEATFYAHTKGNSTAGSVEGATYWRNGAYHHLLDRAAECSTWLKQFPAVGIHKMTWVAADKDFSPYPSRLRHGRWMFAGTFFWFRNDIIFGHSRCLEVPADRYGAEAYLSGLLPHWHAKSVWQLWPELKYPWPNPYKPELYQGDDCMPDRPLPPRDACLSIPAESWEGLMRPKIIHRDISCVTPLRPAQAGPKTVLVLGMFRGGTSIVAEALHGMGVSMGREWYRPSGPGDYCNFEDAELVTALRDDRWDDVEALVRSRDASGEAWGFKWPDAVRHLDRLIPLLRNPHLLVVMRDPVASWQSDHARGHDTGIGAIRFRMLKVLECFDQRTEPAIAISYERAKERPGEMREAIREFLQL